ncbi:TPA: hypothetical protein DDW35_12180, partial [Candidatus Sumerlaeota bacterium]|nr:hypothetical protein [Candidatus Sumerlaeota bacterium]
MDQVDKVDGMGAAPVSSSLPILQSYREFIRCVWSLLFTITVLVAVSAGIVHIWHPDTASLLKKVAEISPLPLEEFQPAPREKALYLFVVLSSPFLLAAGYQLAGCGVRVRGKGTITVLYFATVVVVLALLGWLFKAACLHPVPRSCSYLQYYASWMQWYNQFYIYSFLGYPVALYLIFRVFPHFPTGMTRKLLRRIATGCVCVLVIIAASGGIFHVYTLTPLLFSYCHDFDTVFAPSVFVRLGHPLLTGNLQAGYGLYPHFLHPVFALVGLSVFKFTVVMAILNAMAFFLYLG